jgi:hypothetical protein
LLVAIRGKAAGTLRPYNKKRPARPRRGRSPSCVDAALSLRFGCGGRADRWVKGPPPSAGEVPNRTHASIGESYWLALTTFAA